MPFLPNSVELCAGAGGQASGIESAGFGHEALVEIDRHACITLRNNRPGWNIFEGDVADFDGRPFRGVELMAGGLPCPPFSKAGLQRGEEDERNLFPQAMRLVDEIRPKAVMFENVRGLLDPKFEDYRKGICSQLGKLGYGANWMLLNARDFGVPQLRPRVVIVALRQEYVDHFEWPQALLGASKTVGETLYDLMASRQWRGAKAWASRANRIAPTIVGGSKKHGGPDLGPTRAKREWATLGVDGMGIADESPDRDFVGMPRLTVQMVARLQGFSDAWAISGRKTHAYRQVGNAFPPPVARAVAENILGALTSRRLFVSQPRLPMSA